MWRQSGGFLHNWATKFTARSSDRGREQPTESRTVGTLRTVLSSKSPAPTDKPDARDRARTT